MKVIDPDKLLNCLKMLPIMDDITKLVPNKDGSYSNITVGRKKHELTKEEIIVCIEKSIIEIDL